MLAGRSGAIGVPAADFQLPWPTCGRRAKRSSIMKKRRVAVFVDGANFLAMEKASSIWVDLSRFYHFLERTYGPIMQANYYLGVFPDGEDRERDFRAMLARVGFRVVAKPVKVMIPHSADEEAGSCGDEHAAVTAKANCDVELAVDAIVQDKAYDLAILVTGDGDFVYLLEALHMRGKQAVVISYSGQPVGHATFGTSRDLRQYAGGSYVDLADIRHEIERMEG